MLIPAISFQGKCDEAITFYKESLGAEVKAIYYAKDAPADSAMDESLPPNFVMHSEVQIGGVTITMTDGATAPINGDFFSLMLMLGNTEEVISTYHCTDDFYVLY